MRQVSESTASMMTFASGFKTWALTIVLRTSCHDQYSTSGLSLCHGDSGKVKLGRGLGVTMRVWDGGGSCCNKKRWAANMLLTRSMYDVDLGLTGKSLAGGVVL